MYDPPNYDEIYLRPLARFCPNRLLQGPTLDRQIVKPLRLV